MEAHASLAMEAANELGKLDFATFVLADGARRGSDHEAQARCWVLHRREASSSKGSSRSDR